MAKEYRKVRLSCQADLDELNELCRREGWRVVSTFAGGRDDIAYLERELHQPVGPTETKGASDAV